MSQATNMLAVAATGLISASASAQLVLAFDINGFDYAFTDASGAGGFGGVNHTGSLEWDFSSSPQTVIADARMGEDGRFGELFDVALGATLADFDATIEFSSGHIEGGSLTVTLDNGDTYTTEFAGAGRIQRTSIGGFTIDGLTMDGSFSDDQFGAIDVAGFTALRGIPGSVFAFRFNPSPAGTGTGDAEVFVLVPLPPAAYAGLATLAGAMGLACIRRRR